MITEQLLLNRGNAKKIEEIQTLNLSNLNLTSKVGSHLFIYALYITGRVTRQKKHKLYSTRVVLPLIWKILPKIYCKI